MKTADNSAAAKEGTASSRVKKPCVVTHRNQRQAGWSQRVPSHLAVCPRPLLGESARTHCQSGDAVCWFPTELR